MEELNNCQPYLERDLEILQPKGIVCLGRIAFERVLKLYSLRNPDWKFGHGALYKLDTDSRITADWLLCSYHPSQQNTLTGRLTVEMFDAIWAKAKSLLEKEVSELPN